MHFFTKWLRRGSRPARASGRGRSSVRLELEQLGGGFGSPSRSICRRFRPEMEQLEERRLMSASGLVSAITDFQGRHTDYFIDANRAVWKSDSTGTHFLGGNVTQISAGRDSNGFAEVFAINSDRTLSVFDSTGLHGLGSVGGGVVQISATLHNRCYILGADQHVYWHWGATTATGTPLVDGYHALNGTVLQISAGGRQGPTIGGSETDQVWGIGTDHRLYVNPFINSTQVLGWSSGLGTLLVSQISATAWNECYAIGPGSAVWVFNRNPSTVFGNPSLGTGNPPGWKNLGGVALQISAGEDAFQADICFAIGTDHSVYVNPDNQLNHWVGRNDTRINGTVSAIAGDFGGEVMALTTPNLGRLTGLTQEAWVDRTVPFTSTQAWVDLGRAF